MNKRKCQKLKVVLTSTALLMALPMVTIAANAFAEDTFLEPPISEELDENQKEVEAERDILSSSEFYNPFGPNLVLATCPPLTTFDIDTIEAIKPLRKASSHTIARGLSWSGEDDTPSLSALQVKSEEGDTRIVYIEESLLNKKSLKVSDKIGGFYYRGPGCNILLISVYKVKTLKFFLFFVLLSIISLIWMIRRILFRWKVKKIKKILTIGVLIILTVFLIYIFSILFYAIFLEKGEIVSSNASAVKTVNVQHSFSMVILPIAD